MLDAFRGTTGMIFDCDGTLLDSMKAWREVEFSLIEMTGVKWDQDMLEHMRAEPMREACRIFHEDFGVMDSTEAVADYMKNTMVDYYQNRVEFREGAREFLAQARNAGIPCCIVTSTPARYIAPAMQKLGVLEDFVEVFSTEETGLSKQEFPIYQLALDAMGSQAQTTWGFEDSLYAIEVMNRMGIQTVGCYEADDAGTFEQLTDACTIAVRSFTELLG